MLVALVALRLAADVTVVAQAPAGSPAPAPTPRARGAGIGIGTLAWLDQGLERAELPAKTSWQHLREGDASAHRRQLPHARPTRRRASSSPGWP